MSETEATANRDSKLVEIKLDESTITRSTPDIEQERDVAIFDLIESNFFELASGEHRGPYALSLAIVDNRLQFAVGDVDHNPIETFHLSLSPFKRVMKDYFLICETYFETIRTASPTQIEAVDTNRKAVHNEGSELLMERLKGTIHTDLATARRLFTLLCALHWKG